MSRVRFKISQRLNTTGLIQKRIVNLNIGAVRVETPRNRGNKCQIVVAFDRQGNGSKIVVDGNVKACGRSDIGCNTIRSVKVIGRDCTALMFSDSGTECDDAFCDFTRPGKRAGKCCSNNQYRHCKTIHGQPANTAIWTDACIEIRVKKACVNN